MSTITDAVKKRKKESGEEEAEELVPVDLEEPDTEVPKGRDIRRFIIPALSLLVVAAAAVSVILLFKEMLGGGSAARRADASPRIASLPQPERGSLLSTGKTGEAPPLPGTTSPPASTAEEMYPAAPGTASSPQPAVPEGPSPMVSESAPKSTHQPLPAGESPSPGEMESPATAAHAPLPEGATPSPADVGTAPETSAAPQTDPFAGINLQGIMRFDPTTPEVLINGKVLKVGDSLNGVEVIEIGEESVKLRYQNIEKTIGY